MPLPKSRRDRFYDGMSKGVEMYGESDKQDKDNALKKLLQGQDQEFKGGQGDLDRANRLEIAKLMAGRAQKGVTNQKRLETKALTEAYHGPTKKLREQQQGLEAGTNLLKDPNNLNDQQVRRAMAMAVNSGALSDQDVNDAVPGDIGQTLRKAYNWVQPAIPSVFGAEKKPIYTDENRQQLQNLLSNRAGTVKGQIQDVGSQVRTLAPGLAPTLAEEDPDGLEQLLGGLTAPANAVDQRMQPPQQTPEERLLFLRNKHRPAGK